MRRRRQEQFMKQLPNRYSPAMIPVQLQLSRREIFTILKLRSSGPAIIFLAATRQRSKAHTKGGIRLQK